MIKIGKNISEFSVYSCQPKTKEELKEIIKERISKEGYNCDLNDIDTSLIKDMSYMFEKSDFNGDISSWNVSNVRDMSSMFYMSKFNNDISNWDTSNVKSMDGMFYQGKFNQYISNWKIRPDCDIAYMFFECPIKEEYKPKSMQ